jgi:hypothetical protein
MNPTRYTATPRSAIPTPTPGWLFAAWVAAAGMGVGCEVDQEDPDAARHERVNDWFDQFLIEERRSADIKCPCWGEGSVSECSHGNCPPPDPEGVSSCLDDMEKEFTSWNTHAVMTCMRSSYHVDVIRGEASLVCGVLAYRFRNDCWERAACDSGAQAQCDANFEAATEGCPAMIPEAQSYFTQCLSAPVPAQGGQSLEGG